MTNTIAATFCLAAITLKAGDIIWHKAPVSFSDRQVENMKNDIDKGKAVVIHSIKELADVKTFLEQWDTNSVPQDVRELDANGRASMRIPDGWSYDSFLVYPTKAVDSLKPKVERYFGFAGGAPEKYWRWPGLVNGWNGARPVVMLKYRGRGMLILSTLDLKSDENFRKNLETALLYHHAGFRYHSIGNENFTDRSQKGLSWGSGCIDINLHSTHVTNETFASRLEVEFADGTKRLFEGEWAGVKPGDSSRVRITGQFDFNGKAKAKLYLKNRTIGDELLMKEYELEFPEYLELIPPRYRGMVSTVRRDANVRLGMKFNAYRENTLGREVSVEVMDDKGAVVAQTTARSTGAKSTDYFTVPLPGDAKPGIYRVVAKCQREDGIEAVAESSFKVVAPTEGQVFVDQDGTLLADGEPWFPFGAYHVMTTNDFRACKEIGLNMVQFWSTYLTPENLSFLQKEKMKVVFETSGWGQIINTWRGTLPDLYPFQTSTVFRAKSEMVRDMKGVLAFWYTADEPGIDVIPAVKRLKDYWQNLDPEGHPSYVVSTGDPAISAGADIMGLDIYPRYFHGHRSLCAIGDAVDTAYRSNRPGQCVVLVPQAFGNNKLHGEVPEEVIAMAYVGVVHGVKGLFWYTWWDGGEQGMVYWPETKNAVKGVIAELKPLVPALLSGSFRKILSDDGCIHACLCGNEKTGRYLIAVNATDVVSKSALSSPVLNGVQLEALYGSAKTSADRKGIVKLNLKPCERAVYRVK